ncbi:MAG: hypothetical protein IJZ09_06600 [Tidjanibacter sp.]|nr:hypothetical protein [Tidjanibacter sp.]
MGLNKQELDRVVAFVKAVKELPGNEEFIADLRMVLRETHETKESSPIVEPQKNVTHEGVSNAKIDAIEKYLGLDYRLDSAKPAIDYSFVIDTDVRNQLEADYREMLRCRYGLRGHKTDFFEFCRYVQLQTEPLLNYYYDIKFNSDTNAIKENVILYNPKAKDLAAYGTLLYAFNSQYKIDVFSILDAVRKVRNIQSHRTIKNTHTDSFEIINRVDRFARANKLWFNRQWYNIDYRRFSDDTLKDSFNREIGMTVNEYKEFAQNASFANFVHTTPFAEIVEALTKLANTISDNLKNSDTTNS